MQAVTAGKLDEPIRGRAARTPARASPLSALPGLSGSWPRVSGATSTSTGTSTAATSAGMSQPRSPVRRPAATAVASASSMPRTSCSTSSGAQVG